MNSFREGHGFTACGTTRCCPRFWVAQRFQRCDNCRSECGFGRWGDTFCSEAISPQAVQPCRNENQPRRL